MTPDTIRAVQRAATAAYPRECCGLLLGHEGRDGQAIVEDVAAVANIAAAPRLGYELDPEGLLAAESDARGRGLTVLGIFHSHPDGAARPSARDLRTAVPGWLYAVAGVSGVGKPEVRVYRLRVDGSSLDEVPLC